MFSASIIFEMKYYISYLLPKSNTLACVMKFTTK